jgi:NADH-quinone oxidoreductase subunit J
MWEEITATLVFYFLATLAIVAAVAVVKTSRILRSAVFLAGVLLCNAGFFILLGYEFLAGVQVLVYIGGIIILIVFAIMLTSSVNLLENQPEPSRRWWGLIASVSFFVMVVSALQATDFAVTTQTVAVDEVSALGFSLLNYGAEGYVLPFEIISLLLLSVLIGGIIIARKVEPPSDREN